MLRGFLGDGVAASLAIDAQAKGLGEYLRAKEVPIPAALLEAGRHPLGLDSPSSSAAPDASGLGEVPWNRQLASSTSAR